MIRTCLSVFSVVSIAFFPPWVLLFPLTALSLRYKAIEVPLLGFAMDATWLSGTYFGLPFFTLFGIIVLWACEPIRASLLISE